MPSKGPESIGLIMRPFSIFHLGRILLVSLQEEIDDSQVLELLQELSDKVQALKAEAIIVDLSDVEVMDTFLAENILKLASTMKLFRAETVVAGLGAPAITALKSFNMTFGRHLIFALDTEQALEKLGKRIVSIE